MRKPMRLGEQLVQAGLLTAAQLDGALEGQRKSGKRLGEYLVDYGYVKEEDVAEVVSSQLKLPRYQPKLHAFDVTMAEVVEEEAAKRFKVVPLNRDARRIRVAMVDANDIYAIDDLEIMTNLEVEPVVCTRTEFEHLFESIYESSSTRESFIENFESADDEATNDSEHDPTATDTDVSADSLASMADEAPVIKMVNSILAQAVKDRASDIHFSPEKRHIALRFRIDGGLKEIPAPPKKFFLPIISRLKILANMDIAVSRVPQDGRFTFHMEGKEINVRASSLPTIYGENMVLRLIDMSGGPMSLEQLGFEEHNKQTIQSTITKPWGMMLTTGPTGSGKSTTLYACLNYINRPDINIITLEDPVESRIDQIRQVQLNTRAGMTFASGLRSILRQDPDVVMVGEIRDGETANIATKAAMTGHMVISTLHTNDAASAIGRLVDMGVEPFLVASTLMVSIAQRLLRRNCKECLQPYTPVEQEREALMRLGVSEQAMDEAVAAGTIKRGSGCVRCNHSGYKGRVGVYEVLEIAEDVQRLIMQRATSREIETFAVEHGIMKTLREDAAAKVLAGLTTVEEAASKVLL